MGSSYWVYGTRPAKLGPFPWDYYNHRIIMSQRLEKTPKIIPPRVQTLCWRLDCLASFSPLRSSYDFSGWISICHLPPLTMPSSLPSHPTPPGEVFPGRNITTKSHRPAFERDSLFPRLGKGQEAVLPPSLQSPPASPTRRCCISPLLSTNSPHRKVPE